MNDHDDHDDDRGMHNGLFARDALDRAGAEPRGYNAGWADRPRTACPWSPGSDEGRRWLQGWASGVADRKDHMGEMEHLTGIMRHQLRDSIKTDPRYQADPTDVLDLEPDPQPWQAVASKVLNAWMQEVVGRWFNQEDGRWAARAQRLLHARDTAADSPHIDVSGPC